MKPSTLAQAPHVAVLRMYWDGEKHPSVEVPLGDFFGCGFGTLRYFRELRYQDFMRDVLAVESLVARYRQSKP